MTILRYLWVGLRAVLLFTVVLGLLYPAAVWAAGRMIAPREAAGSIAVVAATPVASTLIGQDFSGDRWFIGRPSAAGHGYDAVASGGTDLGPNAPELTVTITARRAAIAARDGVAAADVPPDAVTASGSGLDPDISPAYADEQVPRIARARGITETTVRQALRAGYRGRTLGFLGNPRINVIEANLALQTLDPR